jgi:3-oxoadipate enol-lactonase
MSSDLFFQTTGPEKAATVVFSHAVGGDLSLWNAQIEAFSPSYQLLRYDLRGHGRSPQPESALSIEDLGRDVLNLLDERGIERIHFCGLSLGGLIGQWLGVHGRNRLLSLTLVDTAPRMGTPDVWNQRFDQISRGGMSAVAAATMERWFTQSFRAREPETVARIRSVLESMSPAGYMACAKVVRDTSIGREDLRGITTPTLVVTGTFDAAATPDQCRDMAAQIPGSRYVELNAAHISPVEAGKEFNEELSAFLRDL